MLNPRKATNGAEAQSGPTLKARPRLFVALCVAFGVWIALLIVLYFLTVYPRRHPRVGGSKGAAMMSEGGWVANTASKLAGYTGID